MRMSIPQIVVVLTGLLLQVTVMALMVTRRLRSSFPVFFAYMGFYTLSVLCGLAVYLFAFKQYVYVYWSLSTLVMLLGFAVLYEVFINILKPYSAVIDLGKMLFMWAGLFLLLAAFLTAVVTSAPRANRVVMACDLLDRCVHLMQCGMLMLLVFFEKRLNLSWRSNAMCIAMGMGVSATIDLMVAYGQNRFPQFTSRLDLVNGIAFVCVLASWTFALMSKQPARSTAAGSPTRLILQRWNDALTSYGYGDVAYASTATDSFLPGVEKTVDRVLARKIVH